MMQHSSLLWIVLLVGGVFGDENVPVSVMEGDSVTLISNLNLENNGLNWYINDNTIIAKIDEDTQKSSVEVKEENLKRRLKLNETTGSLTIINVSRNDTKDYKLQTTGKKKGDPKIFKVIVNGEKQRVSVTEGENVFLITGVKDIQTYDLILNLEGRTIAEIYTNDHSGNNNRDARLLLDILNGSLIIRNSATTDTGDYDLTMSSSTYSIQRTISVTVSNLGLSAAALAGIVVGLLLCVAVMGFLCYYCKTSAK